MDCGIVEHCARARLRLAGVAPGPEEDALEFAVQRFVLSFERGKALRVFSEQGAVVGECAGGGVGVEDEHADDACHRRDEDEGGGGDDWCRGE